MKQFWKEYWKRVLSVLTAIALILGGVYVNPIAYAANEELNLGTITWFADSPSENAYVLMINGDKTLNDSWSGIKFCVEAKGKVLAEWEYTSGTYQGGLNMRIPYDKLPKPSDMPVGTSYVLTMKAGTITNVNTGVLLDIQKDYSLVFQEGELLGSLDCVHTGISWSTYWYGNDITQARVWLNEQNNLAVSNDPHPVVSGQVRYGNMTIGATSVAATVNVVKVDEAFTDVRMSNIEISANEIVVLDELIIADKDFVGSDNWNRKLVKLPTICMQRKAGAAGDWTVIDEPIIEEGPVVKQSTLTYQSASSNTATDVRLTGNNIHDELRPTWDGRMVLPVEGEENGIFINGIKSTYANTFMRNDIDGGYCLSLYTNDWTSYIQENDKVTVKGKFICTEGVTAGSADEEYIVFEELNLWYYYGAWHTSEQVVISSAMLTYQSLNSTVTDVYLTGANIHDEFRSDWDGRKVLPADGENNGIFVNEVKVASANTFMRNDQDGRYCLSLYDNDWQAYIQENDKVTVKGTFQCTEGVSDGSTAEEYITFEELNLWYYNNKWHLTEDEPIVVENPFKILDVVATGSTEDVWYFNVSTNANIEGVAGENGTSLRYVYAIQVENGETIMGSFDKNGEKEFFVYFEKSKLSYGDKPIKLTVKAEEKQASYGTGIMTLTEDFVLYLNPNGKFSTTPKVGPENSFKFVDVVATGKTDTIWYLNASTDNAIVGAVDDTHKVLRYNARMEIEGGKTIWVVLDRSSEKEFFLFFEKGMLVPDKTNPIRLTLKAGEWEASLGRGVMTLQEDFVFYMNADGTFSTTPIVDTQADVVDFFDVTGYAFVNLIQNNCMNIGSMKEVRNNAVQMNVEVNQNADEFKIAIGQTDIETMWDLDASGYEFWLRPGTNQIFIGYGDSLWEAMVSHEIPEKFTLEIGTRVVKDMNENVYGLRVYAKINGEEVISWIDKETRVMGEYIITYASANTNVKLSTLKAVKTLPVVYRVNGEELDSYEFAQATSEVVLGRDTRINVTVLKSETLSIAYKGTYQNDVLLEAEKEKDGIYTYVVKAPQKRDQIVVELETKELRTDEARVFDIYDITGKASVTVRANEDAAIGNLIDENGPCAVNTALRFRLDMEQGFNHIRIVMLGNGNSIWSYNGFLLNIINQKALIQYTATQKTLASGNCELFQGGKSVIVEMGVVKCYEEGVYKYDRWYVKAGESTDDLQLVAWYDNTQRGGYGTTVMARGTDVEGCDFTLHSLKNVKTITNVSAQAETEKLAFFEQLGEIKYAIYYPETVLAGEKAEIKLYTKEAMQLDQLMIGGMVVEASVAEDGAYLYTIEGVESDVDFSYLIKEDNTMYSVTGNGDENLEVTIEKESVVAAGSTEIVIRAKDGYALEGVTVNGKDYTDRFVYDKKTGVWVYNLSGIREDKVIEATSTKQAITDGEETKLTAADSRQAAAVLPFVLVGAVILIGTAVIAGLVLSRKKKGVKGIEKEAL